MPSTPSATSRPATPTASRATADVEAWLRHPLHASQRPESFYRQLVAAVRQQDPALPPVPALPSSTRPLGRGPAKVAMYVAHPDDEAGFAGGTLHKLAAAGNDVEAVILSHGEGGRVVEHAPDGSLFENRSYSLEQVVRWRRQEVQDAAARLGVTSTILLPPTPMVDFGYTTSTAQTLQRWDRELPGGLEHILELLVADLRRRRPDAVLTLAQEDGPEGEGHGHHKAMGILVELATRLAADPAFGSGAPHVVRELTTVSPDARDGTRIQVDKEARRDAMRAYRTQFLEEMLHGDGWERPTETFRVRWQAQPAGTSMPKVLLKTLADRAPSNPPNDVFGS